MTDTTLTALAIIFLSIGLLFLGRRVSRIEAELDGTADRFHTLQRALHKRWDDKRGADD